jgi:hypothetical protein
MSVLQITKSTNAVNIWFDETKMNLVFGDGRELSVLIDWFPSLRDATSKQRNNYRFIGDGEGIHWEDLDQDIFVEGLL